MDPHSGWGSIAYPTVQADLQPYDQVIEEIVAEVKSPLIPDDNQSIFPVNVEKATDLKADGPTLPQNQRW